jgi:phosphatidylglycerophosphatase C
VTTSEGPADTRPVAAFDFDGTITERDSLLPFLMLATSRRRVVGALGRDLGPLTWAARRGGMRDEAKRRMIARLFSGDDTARLHRLGEAYATVLAPDLRPSMIEQIAWHREQGHRLVIVSASLRYYLDPLGRDLGFDEVIGVELEVGDDGRLTGQLAGPNVRGEEKAVRLRAWMGGEPSELWAYGDSRGDAELLAMATHPRPVGRRARRHVASSES